MNTAKVYDYIDAATKFAAPAPHGDDRLNLAHAALGLSSELVELAHVDSKENLLEELGDITWYAALASKHVFFFTPQAEPNIDAADLDDVCKGPDALQQLAHRVSEIANIAKRHVFYNTPIDDNVRYDLARLTWQIFIGVAVIADGMLGKTLDQVLDANIAKLSARYPVGFTADKATNRDLAAETQAMMQQ